jgi:hypothetical protein
MELFYGVLKCDADRWDCWLGLPGLTRFGRVKAKGCVWIWWYRSCD